MSDCIHNLALCHDCGGLQVTRLDRIPGVTSIELSGPEDSTGFTFSGPVELYIGPVAEPCPNAEPQDPVTT